MFGYTLIKEKDKMQIEYDFEKLQNEIKKLKKDKEIANKTIKQLTSEISTQTKDCKVGPWCDGCKHIATAAIETSSSFVTPFSQYLVVTEEGAIKYCKKHLNEFCPEREV